MYYDITNNTELKNLRTVREARPLLSLPKEPTEQQLLNIDIATVVTLEPVVSDTTIVLSQSIELVDGVYTVVYVYEDIPLDELKITKLKQLNRTFKSNSRPRVSLTLEDGTAIFLDGGRDDKDNFKEEYERMLRNNETVGIIKDADNIKRTCTNIDVKNGYEAIVDYYSPIMKVKWDIEDAINAIVIDVNGIYPTYDDAVVALDAIIV